MRCPRAKIGCAMDEWEPIPISRLSHAAYCLRRAALLTNEQLWSESADTAKGRLEHKRVHTARVERRGEDILLYETDISSAELGISGKCDCVEAHGDPLGCMVPGISFPVRLYPIEYKHGKLREEEEYEIQLCAQAMCLEEMFQTSIPEGALYYISSHRRLPVTLSCELREKVVETVRQVDEIRRTFRIPAAVFGAKCVKCSLRESCMPQVKASAQDYCRRLAADAKAMVAE